MAANSELREFLRSRRARLQPAEVGIEAVGQRRVPGLRREEVAMLAGVSLDYYARLEQGRDLQPSDQVLDAIARALRLAEVERQHLHHIVRAGVAPAAADELVLGPLGAGTQLMLDSLQLPAFVVDARADVALMNELGRALLVGLEPAPSGRSNHARWLFTDPGARSLLVDWEMNARSSVGVLREVAGRHPRDAQLQALVGELSVTSPEFRSWWADHDVNTQCRGLKRFHHPDVGSLELHTEALELHGGNRWMYAYAAEPGSRSEQGLRLLGALAATDVDVDERGAALEEPSAALIARY